MSRFILSQDILDLVGDSVPLERVERIYNSLTPNWAFIVYPDSAPERWLSMLEEYYVPFAVSPIHDKDINPDGSQKKPHYHVLFTFGQSKKSFKQLAEISKSVNGTNLINVDSVKGYFRYFTHMDNPEKYQYSGIDIKCLNGFDSDNFLRPSSACRQENLRKMVQFIEDNNILEFSDFVNICSMTPEYNEWFIMLCDNSTVFISAYIKSRYLKSKDSLQSKLDYLNRRNEELNLREIKVENMEQSLNLKK